MKRIKKHVPGVKPDHVPEEVTEKEKEKEEDKKEDEKEQPKPAEPDAPETLLQYLLRKAHDLIDGVADDTTSGYYIDDRARQGAHNAADSLANIIRETGLMEDQLS